MLSILPPALSFSVCYGVLRGLYRLSVFELILVYWCWTILCLTIYSLLLDWYIPINVTIFPWRVCVYSSFRQEQIQIFKKISCVTHLITPVSSRVRLNRIELVASANCFDVISHYLMEQVELFTNRCCYFHQLDQISLESQLLPPSDIFQCRNG